MKTENSDPNKKMIKSHKGPGSWDHIMFCPKARSQHPCHFCKAVLGCRPHWRTKPIHLPGCFKRWLDRGLGSIAASRLGNTLNLRWFFIFLASIRTCMLSLPVLLCLSSWKDATKARCKQPQQYFPNCYSQCPGTIFSESGYLQTVELFDLDIHKNQVVSWRTNN